MFNSDAELFFPIRVIPSLLHVRGKEFDELIERMASEKADELDQIAFSGMVVKLAGCAGCDADSFRAMRGCTHCAILVIKRYKGTDKELVMLYEQNKHEVKEYLQKREK